ncbi:glycosyl transferase, group 1 family [Spirochaeta thermophila DSM 6192]|uniref:Glycosyl transferase, group 1 family n=2 Tax=Winmispira thermophila TaxID=154 RepID=E0RN41_WINT6|nr:glycosyl transferase, group 1 family [Spirochaeta thermophila DSM 6192]
MRSFYVLVERIASLFARKIITVSEYDRTLALQQRVADSKKIVTIHNGIPVGNASSGRRIWKNPPGLVMVARFEYQKDHPTLFKALSLLRDLEWSLVCVGDGPLLESMKEEAKALGIGDRVEFLGFCEDVEGVLASSQIFVLASRWEGFPISILEAMRAGLPVVASDVGGCREAVVEGETGYLVPRGDHMVLAERLRELILDPGKRERMGRAGRERFLAHFTFDHMMELLLDLYKELTESRYE